MRLPDPWDSSDPRRDKAPAKKRLTRWERVRAEVERNRRGEYRVPTWVLALVLGLVVAGWLAVIIFD